MCHVIIRHQLTLSIEDQQLLDQVSNMRDVNVFHQIGYILRILHEILPELIIM